MSFENYNQFPNPGAQDGGSGPVPPTPQDSAMPGQSADPSQTPFQGVQSGENNAMGGGQEGEKKTLWYDLMSPPEMLPLTYS